LLRGLTPSRIVKGSDPFAGAAALGVSSPSIGNVAVTRVPGSRLLSILKLPPSASMRSEIDASPVPELKRRHQALREAAAIVDHLGGDPRGRSRHADTDVGVVGGVRV
jgi:hypothetical protein